MCDAVDSNIDFTLLQFHCQWLDGKMHHTNPQCLLCESTVFEQSMLPNEVHMFLPALVLLCL